MEKFGILADVDADCKSVMERKAVLKGSETTLSVLDRATEGIDSS